VSTWPLLAVFIVGYGAFAVAIYAQDRLRRRDAQLFTEGLRKAQLAAVVRTVPPLGAPSFTDRRRCSSCGGEIRESTPDSTPAQVHMYVDLIMGKRIPVTIWVCSDCQSSRG
jgi:hypothetical protein